jgi:hypothetical protein
VFNYHHAFNIKSGVEIETHISLIFAFEGSEQSHVPAFYSRAKRPRYPLNTRLVGTQPQYGRFAAEKGSPPCRESNSIRH